MKNIQEKIASYPAAGTIVLRSAFKEMCETGEYNSVTFIVSTNYRCLDTYSPNQRVELLGFYGTIWRTRFQTANFTLTNTDSLEDVLKAAYEEAGNTCEHSFTRELNVSECRDRGIAHMGNCDHVYECIKCKQTASFDSSD